MSTTNKTLAQQITDDLLQLRQQAPLVLNLTNYVVMNNSANALLAIGASPIMAHSRCELAEMVRICGSLVINIGTLDESWVDRMKTAAQFAVSADKPIVLDPVGVGASSFRNQSALEIATIAARGNRLIIRGNASEIIALANTAELTPANAATSVKGTSKGVDATDSSHSALQYGQALAHHFNAEVVISGETDFVIGKNQQQYQLNNGDSLMPKVTGMGCSLSALTGAFAATSQQPGLCAAAVIGIAGQLAAADSKGPGSLQLNLLDQLYLIDQKTIQQTLKACLI